jgi:release factor glutamine methyltransferase
LSQQLPVLLRPGGRAYFEIGYQQGEMLIKLFSRRPWVGARYDLDWAGHDRFFVVEIESVSALSCSRYV